jgi:DNA topoisomerase-2
MKENTIIKLTDREHVLKRQSMYLGSIKPIKHEDIFLDGDKFVYKEYESVDGLLKIINEIIDNSVDEAIRTNFKFATSIRVTVEDDKVTVWDNGRGIPIVKEATTGEYAPVLAFTHAKAGSNFSDEGRTTAGMNGIGSFVCNCFSKDFKVQTADGKNELRLHCKNNMENISFDVKAKKGNGFTQVTFKPDLERFGMEKIDDVHRSLIEQRLIHLAMCYPQVQFKYNKKVVKIKSTRAYLGAFSEDFVHIENDHFIIAIMPNEFDDFRQTSFVNGLNICNGGNHTDIIGWEIVSRLREKIVRKYKTVKPGDIKNKIRMVTIFRGFNNVQFDSQTKERLTNSTAEIRQFLDLESKDWDGLARRVIRQANIYEPIIETFKIKEELKQRQALKALNKGAKKKKIRCEKYHPPIRDSKYLALCEGDSACSSIMSIMGRHEIGYFSMRGVPLNAYEVKAQKLHGNKELASIIQILGLQLGAKDQEDMAFENIILAQDADADGFHINGLLIGFFQRYTPSLLKNNRIKRLKTPIVVLKKKGKIIKHFFDLGEFKTFEKDIGLKGYDCEYKKGLGSWKKEDLQALIQKHGFDYFIEDLLFDDTSEEIIHNWMSSKTSDTRKEYIQAVPFNSELV